MPFGAGSTRIRIVVILIRSVARTRRYKQYLIIHAMLFFYCRGICVFIHIYIYFSTSYVFDIACNRWTNALGVLQRSNRDRDAVSQRALRPRTLCVFLACYARSFLFHSATVIIDATRIARARAHSRNAIASHKHRRVKERFVSVDRNSMRWKICAPRFDAV